ncbi:gluconate:H+ symporter [Halobacillus sp. ACCC02827]|uniref:GntP family permease n=1 Tax=unclassified Halobacillus TaxID=2636472 RepID=UPI0002A4E227|nr:MULTISPECIES: gluconate:H+ symporter [unclassified Halobacillus]ELK46311.1 gluconate permease [Halobacillus sp. BAB-2008]WJE15257.1 gluconate:H+ symporter [Halobacillus sp. ACCC02827]
MEAPGGQIILGLVIGIALLVFLVMKTKIHAFIALIISASVIGLVAGMTPPNVANAITDGFGGTLGSIGIVIGFGVMLGRVMEVAGASERLAYSFVKMLGKRREDWAMALTGYVVSIPIFVDSAFVILTPLLKAISKKTKRSIVTLGVALAIGLVVTHSLVPPTPGPLGVAGIFDVSVGLMILWGLIFSIPLIIVGVFYAKWIGKRIHQLPDEDGLGWIRPEQPAETYEEFINQQENKHLPSLFMSMAPILIPILLIFANTVVSAQGLTEGIFGYIQFFGNPVIAVGIGLVFAIYTLTTRLSRTDSLDRMEEGIKSAGIILLVTGAGGALGNVLRESGSGDYVAELIVNMSVPLVLLPFFVSSFVRLVQGSGTVAMITAASITAPILAGVDGVYMPLAAVGATTGSLLFSYFNDSFYWVVNRMLGIKNAKEQMMVWSIPTTLAWLTAFVMLVVVSFFV